MKEELEALFIKHDKKILGIKVYHKRNHSNIIISLTSYSKLRFKEIRSGCGALVMSGYINSFFRSKEDFLLLKEIINKIKILNRVNAIITTLGNEESYLKSKSYLEEIGFKVVSTYSNPLHSYSQSLLIHDKAPNKDE